LVVVFGHRILDRHDRVAPAPASQYLDQRFGFELDPIRGEAISGRRYKIARRLARASLQARSKLVI
jgi:hypothetical protein